jgi:glycosyltransferase involved in cell wall biosynthesis
MSSSSGFDPDASPFFIVGCPRSGTTLLQRMLNAHPDVAVAPETFFVRRFWERRGEYGDLSEDMHLDRLVDDVTATPEFEEMGLKAGAFREAVHADRRRWNAVFRELLRQFAEVQEVAHVGEKTPNHVLHVSTLHRWYPEAKFVHLVRDPRAVVNSWRTVPWSSGYRWRDAEVWVEYVRAGRDAESTYESHVTSLHFEALVRSPEPELRALCDFLDLPYDDQMLAFHKRDPSTVDVEREPWKRRTTDPIDANVVVRWRQELSSSAQAQVEAVAASEMRKWGYKCETAPLQRWIARLRATVERPVWKSRLILEEFRNAGADRDALTGGGPGTPRLGFLHLGDPEHGVTRYGRILGGAAKEHVEARVQEVTLDLSGDPAHQSDQLTSAAQTLSAADVVQVQYNQRIWGEPLRAPFNVQTFIDACEAPVVVTLHDVRDGYGWVDILRRLWNQRSRSSSATKTAGEKREEGEQAIRRSVRRSAYKAIRFLAYEIGNAWATYRLAGHASRVLVCTHEEARRVRDIVEPSRVSVIPHFVEDRPRNISRVEAKRRIGLEGRDVFGVLGYIHRRKGHDLAVEALKYWPESVTLMLIGRAGENSQDFADFLQDRAKSLGVADRLHFTGYVPEADLPVYLAATDLALCPFRQASASGSLATWIAAERPILASDLPLFEEYNERVPGAIATFDPYTSDSLAGRAMELLERPEHESRPRLRALRNSHALPEVIQQHLEVYEQAEKEEAGRHGGSFE